jgi:acyl carrier protein
MTHAIRGVSSYTLGSHGWFFSTVLAGVVMSLRSTITAQFEQVAQEQKRKLSRLSDDLRLLDSGLDSLSFALIVARLEDAVGFDPFDTDQDVKFPVTFGDFVKLYENRSK